MGDEARATLVLGGNAAESFRRRVEEISGTLNEIAELQDKVKDLKKELKDDGFDTKAINKVLRELRMGADKMASQLELELVLDTYRHAVGLPTDLETAQRLAKESAGALPEKEGRGKARTMN